MPKSTPSCGVSDCDSTYYRNGYCWDHEQQFNLRKRKGVCSFPGCGRRYMAKGYCPTHYEQQRAGKELTEITRGGYTGETACVIDRCGRKRIGQHGYCRRHRDTLRSGKVAPPRRDWDLERVISEAVADGDCLLFKPHTTAKYNLVWLGKGVSEYAHRFVYRCYYNVDLSEKPVHHRCGKPKCVNPKHLQLVTDAVNNREMLARRSYENRIKKLEARVAELEAQLAKQ